MTLSAKNPEALRDLAAEYAVALSAPGRTATGGVRGNRFDRSHFAERLAVTATNASEAAAKLQGWLAGSSEPEVFKGWARSSGAPEIAFLFTGQALQYPGMVRALYDAEPVPRRDGSLY